MAMALLIGIGIGYLLGVQGFGQKIQNSPVQAPQQQSFGPGSQNQIPQQGGGIQQPLNQNGLPVQQGNQQNPLPPQGGGQVINPN